jgi:hypothetical protein
VTVAKHLYVVVGGTWSDTSDEAEHWQFGTRLILNFGTIDDHGDLPTNWDPVFRNDGTTTTNWDVVTGFDVDGPLAELFDSQSFMVDQVIPAAEGFVQTDAFSSQAVVNYLKVSPINQSGHVEGGRVTTATATSSVHGTSGGGLLPLEVACCVSLRTPVTGRAGRGRFYLPAVVKDSLGDHGFFTSTYQGVVADGAVAFLEQLQVAGSGGFTAQAIPIVTGGAYTHYGIINQVKVGSVPDSQRRRRRQLVESYTSESVTYT